LSASWAISTTLLAWRMFVSPLPGDLRLSPSLRPMVLAVAVGGLLAALAFRRRWAYILWLCLFYVSLIGMLSILSIASTSELGGIISDAPADTAAFVVALCAQVVGVVLLLRRPSREWYGIDHVPAPPGEWRADPSGRHQHRYWDGRAWTEHVADDGVASTDPLPEALGGVHLTSAST
jgi:hypothetical protein